MQQPSSYYCQSIQRHQNRSAAMEIVRRVAAGLSGGLLVNHLDDASLVRLLRLYTGWGPGTDFATMRKKIAIIERIEGVDLDTIVSQDEMNEVYRELGDVNLYPYR